MRILIPGSQFKIEDGGISITPQLNQMSGERTLFILPLNDAGETTEGGYLCINDGEITGYEKA